MDWYFLALLVIGLWRCMMIVCGSGTRAQWHSVIAGGGGTQKSSWLLLVRLRRPVHSRASQWICNTAGGGSSMGGGYAARQLPTKSTPAPTWCRPSAHPLSKAWINRAASTATPTLHIDEFHFQPLDHPVALDPCTFISAPIWPPTTEECIKKNWPHVSLHFRST